MVDEHSQMPDDFRDNCPRSERSLPLLKAEDILTFFVAFNDLCLSDEPAWVDGDNLVLFDVSNGDDTPTFARNFFNHAGKNTGFAEAFHDSNAFFI